jgi:hypothetical protein
MKPIKMDKLSDLQLYSQGPFECKHPIMWRVKFGRREGCRLCGREIE